MNVKRYVKITDALRSAVRGPRAYVIEAALPLTKATVPTVSKDVSMLENIVCTRTSMASACAFSGDYHDTVWGTALTSSKELFAQLSLASQQAGVSWRTIWNKRHDYSAAFHQWNMQRVSKMMEADLDVLCDKEGPWAGRIMQNRTKLSAIIHNARQCVIIDAATPGGLAAFLWSVVVDASKTSRFQVTLPGLETALYLDERSINALEACGSDDYKAVFGERGEFSDALVARLKRTGEHKTSQPSFEPFKFLGALTVQAFMLQCGLLNGHSCQCFRSPRAALSSTASPRACGKRAAVAGEQEAVATQASRRPRRLLSSASTSDMAASGTRAASSTDHVWL